jgi:hypothetical protein
MRGKSIAPRVVPWVRNLTGGIDECALKLYAPERKKPRGFQAAGLDVLGRDGS